MSRTLSFTIVNSQLVSSETAITFDGEPAIVTQQRTVIEAAPADDLGKTLSAVLPSDALAEFPEGATLTVTLDAVAPAAQPTTSETETSTNG